MSLQLRIDQRAIHTDFEAPTVGRHQGERFNLMFKFLEQVCRQTDGAAGIVSNGTIDQVDVQRHGQ